MRKLTLILFLGGLVNAATAQLHRPQTKEEMLRICNTFMDGFVKGTYVQAFDSIKPYTTMEDERMDTMAATLARQMKDIIPYYGKVLSYVLVDGKKEIKDVLDKLNYVVRFEKSFILATFVIYNNGNGWTITYFNYSNKTDELF